MYDGLCGIYRRRSRISPIDNEACDQMVAAARHRARATSEMHRSDVCVAAEMAMFEVDPRSSRAAEAVLHVLFHGRLDNRDDLARLLRLGPEISDHEYARQAYLRWGPTLTEHLVGDFSLAIVDVEERQLVLARDPLGMRPLYYRIEPDRVPFASEVAQILAAPGVPREVNREMVGRFLADSAEPLSMTFYKGVSQVEPGETIVIGQDRVDRRRRWDEPGITPVKYSNYNDYLEHFVEIFSRATRDRLRDAGLLAVSLSGGMDSTSVTAVAAHELREAGHDPAECIRTYSFAFEDFPESDERHISSVVAGYFGIPAYEVSVRHNMPMSDYPQRRPHFDDPYLLGYSAGVDEVNRMAAATEARTMLSGYRGDLLAGEAIVDYPGLLRRGQIKSLYRELRMQADWRGSSITSVAKNFLAAPIRDHYLDIGVLKRARQALRLRRHRSGAIQLYPPWIAADFTRELQLAEFLSSRDLPRSTGVARTQRLRGILMPSHMRGIIREERDCAHAGLRFVDVWSDIRLAEFAIAVPQRVWNTTGEHKRLVRTALTRFLPVDVTRQIRKIYPTPVYDRAMRNEAAGAVRELLTHPLIAQYGFVDVRLLRDSYESFVAGGSEPRGLWSALCLERWLRSYHV
jgi:asparagine synthase (glutamine-hydrolysing)